MIGLLFTMASASGWTLDTQAAVGMRTGLTLSAEHALWRGVVVSGSVYGVQDVYGLAPRGPTFERQLSLRFAALPGLGLRHRFGKRDRGDVFATWHVGPELLRVNEVLRLDRADGIDASFRRTEVVVVSGIRLGVRHRFGERFGLAASLWTPTLSGQGGFRLERVHLGLGLTARLPRNH